MTAIVHLNGDFVSADFARVSVFDGGWLHGAGLFETMRAEHGRVFRLEHHLDRLRRSAETILRPIERGMLPDADTFHELLARNELESARVRLTVTAGSMLAEPAAGAPVLTICATASPLSNYPHRMYDQGVRVALCDFRVSPSDPLAGHKTTSYLPRLLGLRAAQAKDCFEALWFTTQGHLAEGSISNVFIVTRGELMTPLVHTPVLPGIARAFVMRFAGELHIAVREDAISGNQLLDADEVFLTNSIMQIMPVIAVERHDIGNGRPGPTTKRLLEEYRQQTQRRT